MAERPMSHACCHRCEQGVEPFHPLKHCDHDVSPAECGACSQCGHTHDSEPQMSSLKDRTRRFLEIRGLENDGTPSVFPLRRIERAAISVRVAAPLTTDPDMASNLISAIALCPRTLAGAILLPSPEDKERISHLADNTARRLDNAQLAQSPPDQNVPTLVAWLDEQKKRLARIMRVNAALLRNEPTEETPW